MNELSPEAAPDQRRWRIYHLAVLLAFVALAYTYVWTIQPGYGPDEPRHFAYVKRLVEKGALPRIVNNAEEDGAHALHPPLYYALVSPVYLATRGLGDKAALRAIKHVSPLLLLGALLLFLAMLRRLFPERPFAIAAALTLVALLPEFHLEASVMNNDSLAVLLAALLMWFLVRSWDEGPSPRTALLTGLIMAALVNAKAIGLTLAPLWALALWCRARGRSERPALWWRDLALGYGVFLLLGCGWYVRNYLLYGQPVMLALPNDPLAAQYLPKRIYPDGRVEFLSPVQVYTTGEVLPLGGRAVVGLFQSFWTQIDWVPEPLRPTVFGGLLVLVLAAVAGGVLKLVRWQQQRRAAKAAAPDAAAPAAKQAPAPLVVPAAAFGLAYLNTAYLATFVHLGVYQGGRYLMPAVFGAGALLAAGWEAIVPLRARFPAVLLLALLLVGLNVLCLNELITVLNPRYVRP